MNLQSRPLWPSLLGAAGLALAGLAVANRAAARRAESRHPPRGRFVAVDGVRLHVQEHGAGAPVLLVHGNIVSGDDFVTSGLVDRLAAHHRVVVIDRPGFGWSERPRGAAWSAAQQAGLLRRALHRLGVRRPVIVGHSWGALVALAMAQRHPEDTAGLVLISGYYVPTARLDAALVAPVALPVLGDILRHTVSPLLGRLQMPMLKRTMFAPAPVTARFRSDYADGMALRPSQIRATAMDGAAMVADARGLQAAYAALAMPVVIIAGTGDRIVARSQPRRLHEAVPGSILQLVEGAGHMVHHSAPDTVAAAIAGVASPAVAAVGGAAGRAGRAMREARVPVEA